MSLTLSWDLFIIVFLATVVAYGFIIGKTQSVRVIVACYVSILATQGIGNILTRLGGETQAVFGLMGLEMNTAILAVMKIIVFAVLVIILCMRSGIDVSYSKEVNSAMSLVYTFLFGLATAGLLVSTILTYAVGGGLLDQSLPQSETIMPVLEANPIMEILVVNQDLWFTIPALLLVIAGLIRNVEE